MRKEKYWFKLDNAGKIFPAVSKDNRSNVFRLSFYLDETIDSTLLEQAVNKTIPRFEAFAVQLKNGFFWNYFSENHRYFKVEEEPDQLCKYFRSIKNSGYLFKVYYLKNKVTLEMFHAITDGAGALHFLQSIVFQYFKLRGFQLQHDNLILGELPASKKESEDNFVSNYDKNNKIRLKEEKAYHFSGETFKHNWVFFYKIKLDSKQLIALVKEKYQATITQYITALLAYSIYKETVDFRGHKKPLKAFIPVNLRPYFDSVTLRNFSLYIKTSFSSERDWTFEEMLELTKESFKEQLIKGQLHGRINALVGFEKNWLVRMLPLVLKTIAFKIGYNLLGSSINSISLSNLGIVNLPEDLQKKVLDVDFVNAGYGVVATLISLKGQTNLILTSPLKDISMMNFLTQMLIKEGLKVVVDTNYKEGYDEIL